MNTRESQQMCNFALRMKFQRIALFISGKGSNARNIMRYFQNHPDISVSLVLSTVENTEMHQLCLERGITFEQSGTFDSDTYLSICSTHQIDWVILAGFLKKIPAAFVGAYPNRVINIHPALLPNFGGKGMYGAHVHKAVAEARMPFSGISIHFVNEEFDKGKLLAQFAVALPHLASAERIEQEVRSLEIKHFPTVIEQVIRTTVTE